MKNSIKVIAILCTFFILFIGIRHKSWGLASEEPSSQLTPYGTQRYSKGYGFLSFEDGAAYNKSLSGKLEVNKFTNNQHTTISLIKSDNSYLQFKDTSTKNEKLTVNPHWELKTNSYSPNDSEYYASEFSTNSYDYYVLDFDICADEYVYTYSVDGNTVTSSTIDASQIPDGAVITSKKLAYPEGLHLCQRIGALNIKNGEIPNSYNYIRLYSEDEDWYIHAGSSSDVSNTGVKLSKEAGEWNHITVVISVNRTEENRAFSMQYTYLNGDLIFSDTVYDTSYNITDFAPFAYRIEFPYEVTNLAENVYSFGIDNFAANFYVHTGEEGRYTSGEGVYGIDDYFLDGKTEKGLYNCEDIVYNNLYISGNEVANVDGITYNSMKNALLAVQSGSTITLKRGLDEYIPTVDKLTVIAPEEIEFAIAESVKENYSVFATTDGGITTYDISSVTNTKSMVFKDAKYNLTTTTSFIGNFYVKAPSVDAGYTVDIGVGSGYVKTIAIDNENYYWFTGEPLVSDITAAVKFNITVKIGEATEILTAEYTIEEYFSDAMEMLTSNAVPTEYECVQIRLIMNATRYANELYKYVNDTSVGYAGYEELLSNQAYVEYLTPLDSIDTGEAVNDFTEANSYINGASFEIGDGYSARFVFSTDVQNPPEKITVTYKSITGEYKENVLTGIQQSGIVYYYQSSSVSVYDIISTQIVKVEVGDNTYVSGTYNLSAYIIEFGDTSAGELARALYAYAKASVEYKLCPND